MQLPEDLDVALRGRDCGWTWLMADRGRADAKFDDVAVAAGLEPLGDEWTIIDRRGATEMLTHVLHRDLAYGAELLPEQQASRLAERFLDFVADDRSRYATNRTRTPRASSFSWSPATTHTFDTGVVVVGPRANAVLWVADED